MRKKVVIVIVLFVVAAAGLIVSLRPKAPWELEIDVRFLGMTDDAAGTSRARSELRNIGSVPTDVSMPGFIDIGLRGGGCFGFTNVTLQPGATAETSVEIRLQWRLPPSRTLIVKPNGLL